MKLKSAVHACFLSLVIFLLAPASSASALTDEQIGALSQNCASIKQSLRNLQKTDSRTRVYLGSVYQTSLNNFITPLNLRLVREQQPDGDLADNQSTFTTAREDFNKKFIVYSQSLEELIAIDCQTHPEEFHNKLLDTRDKRADLSSSVKNLHSVLKSHITLVTKLKEEL